MKVEGSYASIIKGVSQQAPADRLEGQHGEVVNLLSDPVRGLVRRNGMILDNAQYAEFTADAGDALNDSYSFRRFEYQDQGVTYDLIYRSRERVGTLSDAHLPALMVYKKDQAAPAFVPVVSDAGDSVWPLYEGGGISAVTSIGNYVLLAANAVAPSYNLLDQINSPSNLNSGVIWIKGGGYGRTYTVTARRASTGVQYVTSYTTPAATFPGVLDFTTAIDPSTPAYQQFINETQAAYDTAVNQWAAEASAAISPSGIAFNLAVQLNALFGGTEWGTNGAHLYSDNLSYVSVSDGGNGDFARAMLNTISGVSDLTDVAKLGKVVKVQPLDNTKEAYYLQAQADAAGPGGYQKVTWKEAAGVKQTPASILAFGRVYENTFYVASTPSLLTALVLTQTGDTIDVPQFAPSQTGDLETVPPPNFFGRRITMLSVFQNRLIIGSDGVVNASRVGDYLNFYRTTLLTIPADDAVEIFALGSEGDTLRQAVLYDRNLTLYGDKFHYVINGRVPLDAGAPNMSVQFSIKNTAGATPVGTGPFVFLLQEDGQLAATTLLQIQSGVYQDTPQLTDVSQQLRDYINGSPAEMVALTNPSMVFIRTEHFLKSQGAFPRARPWGMYLYQYLDGPDGQRLNAAFSAWEWSTALGTPIAISDSGTGDGILLYTVSFGVNQAGNKARGVLVLKASARPDPTGLPYLDGLSPAGTAETTGLWTPEAVPAVQARVYTSPGAAHSYSPVPAITDTDRFIGLENPEYTVGDGPAELVDPNRWTGVQGWYSDYVAALPTAFNDNLWTGLAFPAFVDLTNPFVRDRDGKAKTLGKLTLTKLRITTTRSAGFNASWTDYSGVRTAADYGGSYDRIDYKNTVWVGRDTKQVQIRLAAKDWYPLTINSIEWVGNWFSNTQRA